MLSKSCITYSLFSGLLGVYLLFKSLKGFSYPTNTTSVNSYGEPLQSALLEMLVYGMLLMGTSLITAAISEILDKE